MSLVTVCKSVLCSACISYEIKQSIMLFIGQDIELLEVDRRERGTGGEEDTSMEEDSSIQRYL